MAWTAPRDWSAITDDIVTASQLNTDVRDNLNFLSVHTHTGAAGMGASALSGLTLSALVSLAFADQSANPDAAGELQRNGTDLLWYGSSVVNLTQSDQASGTASLRSLGTSSTTAAAGDHIHTYSQVGVSLGSGTTGDLASANIGTSETDIISVTRTPATSTNAMIVVGVLAPATSTVTGRLYTHTTARQTRTGLVAATYIFTYFSLGNTVFKMTAEATDVSAENSVVQAGIAVIEITI